MGKPIRMGYRGTYKNNPNPRFVPIYFDGGRHIGYQCAQCGGKWLLKDPEWHRPGCRVRKDSLGLDG